ncbi:MAG: serine acetyltransferase [Coriobacteriales bacterium]|nr:serine acetyltransferase [Coriobacteriales bacterium]
MIDNEVMDSIVADIAQNYKAPEICFSCADHYFPSRGAIIDMIKELRRLMFPRYFSDDNPITTSRPEYFIGDSLGRIEDCLRKQVREALLFRNPIIDPFELEAQVDKIVSTFLSKLPGIQRTLLTDVQAAFDGDPAAQSKEEIIFSYPGFFAIFVYRMAHELYVQDVPLIPRIMSEYAHINSGVDINAGAEIDEYFFIDHATGVVIGETTKIGKHVKIYQGVTLGALSTRAGQGLRGIKRHPTIEDNVTIYSNASVLGGETVIGEGSVIAGSIFVTESVPPHSRVTAEAQKLNIRPTKKLANPEEFETVD